MTYQRRIGTQYVYFIKPKGASGPVKIGLSEYPELRMMANSHWVPFPLELLLKIPGDRFLEARFHRMFLDCHSHLEWFNMTPKLQSVIESIKAGVFNFDDLPEYLRPLRFMVDAKPNPVTVGKIEDALAYFEAERAQ